MTKLSYALILTFSLAVAIGMQKPGDATASTSIAVGRCNGQTIDDASQAVRNYDRHGPGPSQTQLLQRYGAIAGIIATLGEEREILNSVCSSDAERAALFTQIAGTMAWAFVLEGDVAARLNAACPAAAHAFPTMMLADAWLVLANAINQDNGDVPPAFADVISKIQASAEGVGLALPAWSDTSQYWRDQVHARAKAAIATCPSPSPTPT
ncbi:MAG: hypothetical protein JO113_04525 [Candidatus Eremiobacteraeota bacterium]|nr:hypothetical protein [Candidatus Eremiobacteraeota bacterium]